MLATLLMCVGTLQVAAQKNIDKLVEELENRDDTSINSVVKRNPETRKIEKVVKSISVKDEKIGKRLIAAFEKDEEYAETAIKDMPKGRKDGKKANFTFIYRQKEEKRTYTLAVDEAGNVSMTIIIKTGKDSKDGFSYTIDDDFMKDLDIKMKDLDIKLKDLKVMAETDFMFSTK